MRAAVQKTIGGFRYDLTPLPAGRGVRMLARLGRVLGPALDGLAKAESVTLEDAVQVASAALGGLAGRIDPDEIEAICREFATVTMVEAAPATAKMVGLADVFDTQFAAAYDDMLAWLQASLEVNFAPLVRALSGGLTTALGAFQAKAGGRSSSRAGSRGSSTASPPAASTETPST